MSIPSFVPIVVLTLALTALAACDSAEERAAKHYESALSLLEDGELERAMVELRNVLALDRANLEARLEYARTARKVGNLPESYENFLRVVETRPDNIEARLALTELAIISQNWDEAERHGKALAEANVDVEGADAAKLALEFRMAAQAEDAARIREITRQAADLFETRQDNVILQRILMEGYASEGNYDAALRVVDIALEQVPDDQRLYIVKGQLLSEAGNFDALEDHLRAMVNRFPDDTEGKQALVGLLASRGQTDDAEAFLRDEIAASEDKSPAHVALVAFLRQMRGPDAALEELERAIQSYEDNGLFRVLKAGIIFDNGERDRAVEIMQDVIEGTEPGVETDRYKVTLAKMLVSTGNEVGARQLVEEVLSGNPNEPNALKMAARWQIDGDQPEEALRNLRLVLDIDPEDSEAMTLSAEAHQRAGSPELAQDLLSLAVEASGNAPRESLLLARLLLAEERYRPAEDVLMRALRRSPGNIDLLGLLSQVYLETGDWGRAQQVESTLRRLNDPLAITQADEIQLQIFGRRDGRDRAIAYLEELIETDESKLGATLALIRSRLAEERESEALELAEQLVEENPDSQNAKLVLANVHYALQDFDTAESVLREAQESGASPAVALQLVRVLGAQGRAEEALAGLDEALESNPDDGNLLWAKATILEQQNDIDGAIGIYERLYAENSASLIVANNLASLLATYRDDEESLERAFVVARRLKGTDVPPFQDTYGWILARRGNYEEALTYLDQAARTLPSDPIVQYHLGKVLEALGRQEDATRAFKRAVEAAPSDDPRAQIAEARAFLETDATGETDETGQ